MRRTVVYELEAVNLLTRERVLLGGHARYVDAMAEGRALCEEAGVEWHPHVRRLSIRRAA